MTTTSPPSDLIAKDSHLAGDGVVEIGNLESGSIRGYCKDTSIVRIGNCRWIKAELCAWYGGVIEIGDRTSINGARIHAQSSKVIIGRDCMFSDGIVLMGADQHTICDVDTLQPLNLERRDIIIEDHVWIGRNVMVLPGVRIGHGAIIGAGAVVTKDVPSQAVAAGNPARILRKGVTWSRSSARVAGDVKEYLAAHSEFTQS